MKKCNDCQKTKELTEFRTCGKYKDKIYYRGECKECTKILQKNPKYAERQKVYRATEEFKIKRREYRNQPHMKEYDSKYEKSRRTIRNKQKLEYHNFRYENDLLFRLKVLCRVRIRNAVKARHWKKHKGFREYIGCTLEALKSHIEVRFTEGMTWDNQGEWHIDHIIPLSSAKTEQELYKLCHYTNLQPLWAIDNRIKNDKLPI